MSAHAVRAARLLAAAPLLLVLVPLISSPRPTGGQDLGNLLSPGRLSKAHAKLEGLDNCQKCHEPGRKVTAEKCLACHQAVAERIAAKKGVHKDVKGDCVSCHVEHAGVDAELRPFDPKKFDHAAETGFALDGKHAPLAANCQSCHKTRSFLTLQPACASCHADKHKGRMGPDCAGCHSTAVPFKEAAKTFDHSKAAFPLTGAHASVACANCHKTPDFRVAKFGACNDCHRDPHVKPLGVCASCHTTESFKATRRIDHDKTGFPLVGKHAQVPCATCHVQPPTKVHLKSGKCADCHQDPHKGVFKGSDCASCHKETGFAPAAPFDHAQKTGYALEGSHATVACASCHKAAAVPAGVSAAKATVDFRGARKDCASCHRDPHRGELGARCESCHTVKTFRVEAFQHPKFPEFFQAKHATAPCESCHRPGAVQEAGPTTRLFKGLSTDCATCHKDPHLGQLGTSCQSCHTVRAWPIPGYKHQRPDLATFFASKHGSLACEQCHKPRTTTFPAGSGTAVVFKGVSSECASCHEDAHDGMLGKQCQTCHTLKTWKTASRAFHKNTIFPLEGQHLTTPCAACHIDRVFKGTPNRCYDCHWIRRKDDKYETRLGNECGDCHRPIGWNAVNWNHQQRTGFALGAVHTGLPCEACHRQDLHGLEPRLRVLSPEGLQRHAKSQPRGRRIPHDLRDVPSDDRPGLGRSDVHAPELFSRRRPRRPALRLVSPDQRVRRHAPRLLRLSQAPVRRHDQPEALGGWIRNRLRDLSQADRRELDSGDIQPRAGLPAPRRPQCAALRRLPPEQRLHRHAPRLLRLSQAPVRRHDQPETLDRRLRDRLRDLPQADRRRLAPGDFQSRPDLPARRRPQLSAMRRLPQEQRLHGNSARLLRMPQAPVRRHDQPEARDRGLRDGVRDLPQAFRRRLARRRRSSTLDLPARRPPRHAGLRRLPQEQRLHRAPPATASAATGRSTTPRRRPNHAAAGFPTTCESVPQGDRHRRGSRAFSTTPRYFALVGVHAHAAVRRVPQEQRLQGHAPRLLRLPQARTTRRTTTPNHATAGFPTDVRDLSQGDGRQLEPGASFNHAQRLPARRRPRHAAVRRLPQEQRLQGHAPRLLRLPYAPTTRRDDEPQPRRRRASRRPAIQCHKATDANVETRASSTTRSVFPLVGVHATQAVRRLPQERHLQGHAARLRRLPHGPTTTRPRTPTTRPPGFPTTCDPCHKATGRHVGPGRLQSRAASSRSSASTRRNRAPPATRTASTRARRATASAATGRTTTKTTNPNHAAAGLPDDLRYRATRRPTRPGTSGVFNHTQRLPARRRPRHAALRRLPQERHLRGHAARLLRLPQAALRRRPRTPSTRPPGFPTTCETSATRRPTPSWNQGQVQPRRVPDHERPARQPGLRRLPHESHQLHRLHLHELPRPRRNGRSPPRRRWVPLRIGRVLFLPPHRTEQLSRGSAPPSPAGKRRAAAAWPFLWLATTCGGGVRPDRRLGPRRSLHQCPAGADRRRRVPDPRHVVRGPDPALPPQSRRRLRICPGGPRVERFRGRAGHAFLPLQRVRRGADGGRSLRRAHRPDVDRRARVPRRRRRRGPGAPPARRVEPGAIPHRTLRGRRAQDQRDRLVPGRQEGRRLRRARRDQRPAERSWLRPGAAPGHPRALRHHPDELPAAREEPLLLPGGRVRPRQARGRGPLGTELLHDQRPLGCRFPSSSSRRSTTTAARSTPGHSRRTRSTAARSTPALWRASFSSRSAAG